MLLYNAKEKKIIEPCKNSKESLKDPGRKLRDDEEKMKYLLEEELLLDEASFDELLELWIRPCMNRDEKTYPSMSLFQKGAAPDSQRQFLDDLFRRVTRVSWPSCPYGDIKDTVDKCLKAAPAELRLRVKTICVFLGLGPNHVFEHGEDWYAEFIPNQLEEELLELRDGDIFPVCLDGVKELTPRLLYNPENSLCTIKLCYNDSEFFVKIPPHGALRALFGDSGCQRMLCVKGCISANPATDRNAFIRLFTEKKSALYMVHNGYKRRSFPYSGLGNFRDAAADGAGGAIVIKDNGVYYTATEELKSEPELPLRVYGAGVCWALQYADGKVVSNMRKSGRKIEFAWALAENGSRSILFLDKDGTWECFGPKTKPISRDEFVKQMLSRFENPDCCEQVEANSMRIRVRCDGKLEVC